MSELCCPLSVCSGSAAACPDRPASLQRGAAPGQCHAAVCGQRGFPSDWTLSWRVGGASTEGSHSPGVLRGDSLYDRISVLQLSTEHWRDASVMCEAHRSGQSPVTQGLEAASCSQ
ncbi:unnamed protein product [Knipowitschia caucasica]